LQLVGPRAHGQHVPSRHPRDFRVDAPYVPPNHGTNVTFNLSPLPFDLLGVVDLRGVCAVNVRAGQRDLYEPVRAVGGVAIELGDGRALARAYIERLGITELYVADLDAIVDRAPQDALVGDIAALGAPLWLDAGIMSADEARHALASICQAVGGDRVAFSLDLRAGEPVVRKSIAPKPAHALAARAAGAGVGAVIVLDLARVGTTAGLDLELIARVREAAPGVTLLVGGGVRGWDDLVRLKNAGCNGALVATALLDGRLGAPEILAARTQLPTPN